MYCITCGAENSNEAQFCKFCGTSIPNWTRGLVENEPSGQEQSTGLRITYAEPAVMMAPAAALAPAYARSAPAVMPARPVVMPDRRYTPMMPKAEGGRQTVILVFGILGVSLFFFGITGFVFSIIAKCMSNSMFRTYGRLTKKASVGRKLANIGIVLSIVGTALLGLLALL